MQYEGKKNFAPLKSLKKGVGSGSVSKKYGSAPKYHGSPKPAQSMRKVPK